MSVDCGQFSVVRKENIMDECIPKWTNNSDTGEAFHGKIKSADFFVSGRKFLASAALDDIPMI